MQSNFSSKLHVGIIMDGNRRWAKTSGLPSLEGHRAGYNKLNDVLTWCKDAGVKNLIVYAFSTENWNRTKEEVGYLMNLFREMIGKMTNDAVREDTRLIFLGERSRFDEDIRRAIEDAECPAQRELRNDRVPYPEPRPRVALGVDARAHVDERDVAASDGSAGVSLNFGAGRQDGASPS